MFALINDIAAFSGNASPAICSSSSRLTFLYSTWSPISPPSSGLVVAPRRLVALIDRRGLRCLGDGRGVVRKDVGGERQVDRDRDVRVHQRHRGLLRKRLPGELLQLLPGDASVLHLLRHLLPPSLGVRGRILRPLALSYVPFVAPLP